jgi:hypothetical protein
VVDGEAYRALTGTVPEFALPFLRWAMILRDTGDRAGAAEAMLQAAWSAGDAADSINGARWRAEAAFLWGEPADVETALRRIDVLPAPVSSRPPRRAPTDWPGVRSTICRHACSRSSALGLLCAISGDT